MPLRGEYEIADLSRERCFRSTERSVGLRESTPMADEKVAVNKSVENIREVFEIATLDARSSTAFDAACLAISRSYV